jgi:anti-sigma factor RsiW
VHANDVEETDMNVTREIILDLLPVYLSGEASPATRSLVEEYMKQDPELAQRIRLQWTENIAEVAPSALPPDLELRSLSRTRRLLGLQRWLFGFGFIALSLSNGFSFADGRLKEFHFLLRDYPMEFGICLTLGLACRIAYFSIVCRLRSS